MQNRDVRCAWACFVGYEEQCSLKRTLSHIWSFPDIRKQLVQLRPFLLYIESSVKLTSTTGEEIGESTTLLTRNRENGHLLNGVFGVVDGGRLLCADYEDIDIKNDFYEDYTSRVEITNVLVYNSKSDLIHAAVNYPRSWHQNKLACASRLVHPKLNVHSLWSLKF